MNRLFRLWVLLAALFSISLAAQTTRVGGAMDDDVYRSLNTRYPGWSKNEGGCGAPGSEFTGWRKSADFNWDRIADVVVKINQGNFSYVIVFVSKPSRIDPTLGIMAQDAKVAYVPYQLLKVSQDQSNPNDIVAVPSREVFYKNVPVAGGAMGLRVPYRSIMMGTCRTRVHYHVWDGHGFSDVGEGIQ